MGQKESEVCLMSLIKTSNKHQNSYDWFGVFCQTGADLRPCVVTVGVGVRGQVWQTGEIGAAGLVGWMWSLGHA